ncbi:MAG: DUF429 domain-containing protein [Pirellulales bacterium]
MSRPLHDGGIVIGVDFTSAPSSRKPLTVAVGRWRAAGRRPTYALDEIRAFTSLDEFDGLLTTPGPWTGGFDLPFSQPRSLIEHEGWPTDWPAFVRFYCDQPRDALRDVFRRWCDGRPAGDKFAWRATDKPAGSSPAMRWANPPVAWMMHAGIGRMLAAGLTFPAHRHAPRGSGRIALEAYPGFTARSVCRQSYKSDTAAKQTPDRRANRRAILAALEHGTAGLDLTLAITPTWRRRLIANGSGDLLDAVICALQAAHAAALPRYGLPRDLDPLEGWIGSVPDTNSP